MARNIIPRCMAAFLCMASFVVCANDIAATGQTVPALSVRWACGDCEINEKAALLLVKSYMDEATANGYTVSDKEVAEVEITDYRQRPPGVRVMFGVMAGKDRLGATINYRGKVATASDYSANAWYGMNSLCEAVAKQSYARIVEIQKGILTTTTAPQTESQSNSTTQVQ